MKMTYQEYLSMPENLTLEEMERLHAEIMTEIGNDTDAMESYEDLLAAAAKYADFRANWYLWSREERMEQDSRRTSCHDMVIIKFNQLARFLKTQGKTASWRDALGDVEKNSSIRKRIGDFACYLVFVNELLSR